MKLKFEKYELALLSAVLALLAVAMLAPAVAQSAITTILLTSVPGARFPLPPMC